MNKSILLVAPLLAAFAASPVLADKGGKGHGNKGKGEGKHQVHRDTSRTPVAVRDGAGGVVVIDRDYDRDDVRVDRRPNVPGNAPYASGRHDNGLHLGWYKQDWRRGQRIDWEYVQPTYYVNDYRRYDLRQPDPGYRWVRPMDDRYLLVEIATGLIVDALGY